MSPHRIALLASLLLWCCFAATAEESSRPVIEYPGSSDFVLIEFTSTGTLSSKPEDRPAFRIYGDGRVFVRRPSYARVDPGDFEAFLSHADLQTLLSLCASKGLLEFDQKDVRKKREAAARKRLETTGSVPVISDAASTIFTVRLAQYAPSADGEVVKDLTKTLH